MISIRLDENALGNVCKCSCISSQWPIRLHITKLGLLAWNFMVEVMDLVVDPVLVGTNLEAGDNPSLKLKWQDLGSNPRRLALQAKSLTTAPWRSSLCLRQEALIEKSVKKSILENIFSAPALTCRRAIAIPLASALVSTCKMLGQMLKTLKFSLSVIFLAF